MSPARFFERYGRVAWCACAAALLTFNTAAAPLDPDLARFVSSKSNAVYLATRDTDKPAPPEAWQMFAAAAMQDWLSTSNLFRSISETHQQHGTHALPPEIWFRVQEVGGFAGLISSNGPKFMRLFADEIMKVVPPGSIYFGGTDPGRFAVTAFSQSQEKGQPFFTLTQNQLADSNYWHYVAGLYRGQIKVPDDTAFSEAFNEYLADARKRLDHDTQFPREPKQVKPGEEVHVSPTGRLQVSGQVAVMAINGILARDIFQANPDRNFYLEESYALDWMYPYLEPAGPIFKLRREPREILYEEALHDDRGYWQRLTARLLGQNVGEDTSLAEVCASAEALLGKPSDFRGDADFLRDEEARKAFSKLRSSISGLYIWRAEHAKSSSERRTMEREAEIACKQAYLFCPYSPEAIMRYVMLLVEERYLDEAQKFLAAARKLDPESNTIKNLVTYVAQVEDYFKKNQ